MNAKQETINFLSDVTSSWNTTIKCAKVSLSGGSHQLDYKILRVGFTTTEYTDWLTSLDTDYDPSNGEQLIGTLWFEDGSWADRYSECNTSNQPEWWGRIKIPQIDAELL